MITSRFSLIALALAFVAGTTVAIAAAADIAFVGPSGWNHVAPANADATRKFDQWKLNVGGSDPTETLTYVADNSASYSDALALVHKNFNDNHIKPSVDDDTTCRGKQGHMIEFKSGPEGNSIIIDRMMVPQDPGLITITYARGEKWPYDDDVKKSIDTFCKGT